MKLVTVDQMTALERICGVPVPQLMENAGLAVAQEAWMTLGDVFERRMLVLAGTGNNGGDGLVAARHLHDWGAVVTLYLLRRRGEDDNTYRQLRERGMPVYLAEDDSGGQQLAALLAEAELVIDALLGTGRSRPVEGPLATVMERLGRVRESKPSPRLLAIDLPTGLNADSGATDPLCVPADVTVALGVSKVGLHTPPGSLYAGRVQMVEIGIGKELIAGLPYDLADGAWARNLLPERPATANKGAFGRVLVVAGSRNYVGAASLASLGAARAGAGLVTLACPQSVYPLAAAKLMEPTFLPLPEIDGQLCADAVGPVLDALEGGYNSLLLGCGLGHGQSVQAFVRDLLHDLGDHELNGVVLDADGLNAVAGGAWWEHRGHDLVITPHPGEMARLTGLSVLEIQQNRLTTATRYAGQWGCIVTLKGANTVVASPDGRAILMPFANPALASGGTGDVLAGAIAGLLAQGLAAYDAAALAAYLHGRAGERLRLEMGDAGVLAGDLPPALPRVMRDLREGND